MKTTLILFAAILCSIQFEASTKTGFSTTTIQPLQREITCSVERILPTDTYAITVKNACADVTYFLYEENSDQPLAEAKGNGQNLSFTGMWGAGKFKVLDDTGQEMSNRVEKYLHWPLIYNFTRSEMSPKYPFSADGAVANLDLYAYRGPELDEGMVEFFDRLNAGDSPNWDPKTMRIHADSWEEINEQRDNVFHIKIFVAPNLSSDKVDNVLGMKSYDGISCYSFYQYPVPEGHLYDWDVHFEPDEIKGYRIRLSSTQYLVEYQLYNYGELVASQLQEPYKEVCFNMLGPGIYTTKVSHQGFSRSNAKVFKVQLDKFIQQKPLITYPMGPTIALDKEGGIMYFTCKRDTIVPLTVIQQVMEEFNSANPSMQMMVNDASSTECQIELIYDPNPSTELIADSKFIFNGESHIRFIQAGSSDLIAYDVLSGMIPQPFIRLSGSQLGVIYELCKEGNPTGISMEGTGQPIAFENVPTGAIFTVRGRKPGQFIGGKPVMCEMNGKALLLVNPDETITPYANAITTKTYLDGIRSYADITYYDGLGAPYQTVYNMAAPDGRNLIQPILFDNMYRGNARQLLPFPVDQYTGERVADPEQQQNNYYARRTEGVKDHSAYTHNVFDKSGMDRIQYSFRPGDIYQLKNKFTEFRYETNNVRDSIYDFRYDFNNGSILVCGLVNKVLYSKHSVIDEDGNKTVIFADIDGRKILERRYLDSDQFAETYYVYDPCYSRLVCVISPEGSARLQQNLRLQWGDEVSSKYCYRYLYDGRGNMVERQLPGRAKESFVYDDSNRLIYSTDANLQNRKQWLYYAYDNHGSLLRQSLLVFIYNESRIFLQNYYNRIDNLLPSLNRAESLDFPYDFDSFISSSLSSNLAAYIYGNVDYVKTSEGFVETQWTAPEDMSFRDEGFSQTPVANPRGLKTYEKLAILGSDDQQTGYLERAFYYDYKDRIIQIVERGPEGGISRTSYQYDLLNILQRKETRQPCAGMDADSITTLYTYDNRCRLIREEVEFNDHPTVDIEYTYNELGELVGKTTRGGALKTAMEYNLQGWLTDTRVTDNDEVLWGATLNYFDPQHAATSPSYTGNITEWSWRNGGTDDENKYAFSYDALSRLTETKQFVGSMPVDRFVEKGLSYDRNGNIQTLLRTGQGITADSLAYSYTGNQLTSLSGTTTGNYTYDANGNMIYDGANDLNISYNWLNLTEKVTRSGDILAKYSYLSDGTKFSATDAAGNGLYYLGSLVYRKQNGSFTLESVGFSGGRFVAEETDNGTVYSPHYFLTDHLGSVRAIVNGEGEVIERNDYYPFGMRWNDPASQFSDNRYRYNGKEEQAFLEVPYTDYGARVYDPRFRLSWGGVDPLAEKMPNVSVYAFCAGSPVLYVDENGKIPRIYTQAKGLGHAFVTIGEGSNTIVYTYGRYGSLYGSSGVTSGRFTPFGEGVLIKKTGEASATYLKDVADEGEFSVYKIENGDDEKTERYYDLQLEVGLSPSGGNKEIYSESEVRVVDNYSLFKNNCVTKTLDGINAGKNILDDPAKAPIGLKNNLDIKSQTDINIIKIEDPLKFVLNLIEIIQSHDK